MIQEAHVAQRSTGTAFVLVQIFFYRVMFPHENIGEDDAVIDLVSVNRWNDHDRGPLIESISKQCATTQHNSAPGRSGHLVCR